MDAREDECIIVDFDEALQKSGAELFKELYRIYPTADAEDYCKQGVWNNDLMKKDLRLLEAHRREAGAPDVPDLEDLKFPSLPASATPPPTPQMLVSAGMKALANVASAKDANVVPVSAGTSLLTGISAVDNVKIIALFGAKHKLNPAMCKTIFSKLDAEQRKHVIMNFKPSNGTNGLETVKELITFIQTCAKEKNWDLELNSTPQATSNATGDTSAATASALLFPSSASTASALLSPTIVKVVGAKATEGMIPSHLINVMKIRPAVGSVTALTPAMVQSMKRPLVPVVSGVGALNWNANKRPALGVAWGSAAPRPNMPKAFPPVMRPPGTRPQGGGLLGNLLSGF